ARAVAHPHADVIVQPLSPFAADGRDESGAQNDAGFVAAAFSLRAPRETSPVVASPFGWHVIQLVERIPGLSEARDMAPAVVSMRARARLDALLRRRREAENVEISSSADAQMARGAAAP